MSKVYRLESISGSQLQAEPLDSRALIESCSPTSDRLLEMGDSIDFSRMIPPNFTYHTFPSASRRAEVIVLGVDAS